MIKKRLERVAVNYKRFGLSNTLKYFIYNGFIKRPLNKINYFTKKNKYPQNIIFITSLPKSGSTWLSNMCAEINGFNLFAPRNWNTYIAKQWDDSRWDLTENTFSEFVTHLAVIRGHTWANPKNLDVLHKSKLKYIIGIRDPRDKLISEYYHSCNFPGHWAYDDAHKKTLDEFITYKLKSGEFEKESIEWVRKWINRRDKNNSIIIRYEDLLNDPENAINKIFSFLGFKINENQIRTMIEKHSFKKISGRKRGESDDTKFVRKGIAGEWVSVFSHEQKKEYSKIGEDVIRKLGYEQTIKNE